MNSLKLIEGTAGIVGEEMVFKDVGVSLYETFV